MENPQQIYRRGLLWSEIKFQNEFLLSDSLKKHLKCHWINNSPFIWILFGEVLRRAENTFFRSWMYVAERNESRIDGTESWLVLGGGKCSKEVTQNLRIDHKSPRHHFDTKSQRFNLIKYELDLGNLLFACLLACRPKIPTNEPKKITLAFYTTWGWNK